MWLLFNGRGLQLIQKKSTKVLKELNEIGIKVKEAIQNEKRPLTAHTFMGRKQVQKAT